MQALANVVEEQVNLISNHIIKRMDTIGAISNGQVPGINDTHLEILENILHGKILNITMEVSKPLHIYVHLPDVFCLKDHFSGWVS